MLIGELSKQTGLSRDTIRFYEKKGLIAVGRKERRFNNYKEYSEHTLQRLFQIKRIKGFGFTLNETASLFDLIETNQASCQNVSEIISEKVILIDQKIMQLIELRQLMERSVDKCLQDCCSNAQEPNCPTLTTDFLS